MASKPILFSTPMVKAILDGRKTQTRRIVKPQPPQFVDYFEKRGDGFKAYMVPGEPCDYPLVKPKYQPGDILWVRETWGKDENGEYVYRTNYGTTEDDSFPPSMFKWKPSIHMPREAARIFLKVTNVKVERLQEITPKDAWEEGCRIGNSFPWEKHIPELQQQCRDILFKSLWDSIYAAPKAVVNDEKEILYYESYPWEDIQETREYKGKPWYVYGNPWVFAYEFERVSEDGSSKDE